MKLETSSEDIFQSVESSLRNEASIILQMIYNNVKVTSNLFDVIDFSNQSCTAKENDIGIYVFMMIKTTPVDFNSLCFNDTKYGAKTNRNLSSTSFLVGDCLYLGKSETGISARVAEHMNPTSTTTYSLRLNAMERQHVINNVGIYTFVLKKEYEKYKKLILPVVEGYLHDNLHPKVGSKRA